MSETDKKPQGTQAKDQLNQLETTLNLYLVKKAPALPANIKELIVNFAPWLVILMAIFVVPSILTLFGLGAMMSATPYGAATAVALGPTYYFSVILLVVVVALELFALPGLFAKKRQGWKLVFYASLVSAVSSIVSLNIVGFILGLAISLYFLFQVREYYK